MLKCDNCRRIFERENQLRHVFPNIPGLLERMEPGGVVPAGECLYCHALVYPVNPVRVLVVLKGGSVQEVLADKEGAEVVVLDQDIEGASEDAIVDITGDSDTLTGILQSHDVCMDTSHVEAAYGKL
jgi:hypothetical protein